MGSKFLSILTLNTRGLRDKKKRENLFYWINQKKIGFTFLQETYWTEDLLKLIQKEWEGNIVLNSGTQHSKGTAILIRKKLNSEILNIHKSEDGRIVLINVKIEGKILSLINIYAPNNQNERKMFLTSFINGFLSMPIMSMK